MDWREDSGKNARGFSVLGVERGEDFVLGAGFGFLVVIADQARGHVLGPAAQAGDFGVPDQIFAVAMVALAVDELAGIVKDGGSFENSARFKIEVMVGPEFVEELQSQQADLLGVLEVAAQSAGE